MNSDVLKSNQCLHLLKQNMRLTEITPAIVPPEKQIQETEVTRDLIQTFSYNSLKYTRDYLLAHIWHVETS